MNIGIVLPNWIGDVVMATPALRALSEHFADARLTGILRPYVDEVLAGTTWLDETIILDTKKRPRLLNIWRAGQQLRLLAAVLNESLLTRLHGVDFRGALAANALQQLFRGQWLGGLDQRRQ